MRLPRSSGRPAALPRISWRGAKIGEGVSLEWRVLFLGEHLRTAGVAVSNDVMLIMPPEPGNAVEVLVLLGPPNKPDPKTKSLYRAP